MAQQAGILPYQEVKKRSPLDGLITAVAIVQYVACGTMVLGDVWEMGLPYRLSRAQVDALHATGRIVGICFIVSWASAALLFALTRKARRGACVAALWMACFATIMTVFSVRFHSTSVMPPPGPPPVPSLGGGGTGPTPQLRGS
jgi:hypothetical protein